MKKAIEIQCSIIYLVLISLLVFVASCTKEYSLDIAIQPANSGTVNVSPINDLYEEGTEVLLSPVPQSGYEFNSWSGSDASGIVNDRIVMSKDMKITANFQPLYSLQVNILPAGSGTVSLSPDGGIYEEGTEVTLSPTPESGYIFTSWSGTDASSVIDNKIVMTKDMDITANFDLQTMIRLKTGSGLNPGASIYWVALSKDDNYFDLEDVWAFEKTDADWYIDGGVIPFTTDYKEFDFEPGKYYFMLRASGLIMRTTKTIISGKQTFEIYASFGSVSVRIVDDTKSTGVFEEESRKEVIFSDDNQDKINSKALIAK
jgi:hypothetical protein